MSNNTNTPQVTEIELPDTNQSWKVGDVVHIREDYEDMYPAKSRGRTYRITKTPVGARGVNYTAEAVDGGAGIRGEGWLLAAGPHPRQPAEVAPEQRVLLPGTVVRVNARNARDGLWVVVDQRGTYRLHSLGGSSRYLRGVHRNLMTEVPLHELAAALA